MQQNNFWYEKRLSLVREMESMCMKPKRQYRKTIASKKWFEFQPTAISFKNQTKRMANKVKKNGSEKSNSTNLNTHFISKRC